LPPPYIPLWGYLRMDHHGAEKSGRLEPGAGRSMGAWGSMGILELGMRFL
jgi:hypothetical protein